MLKFLVILFVFHHGVNCAIRKSWKSSPNFDADVPKFTPFENVDVEVKKVDDDVKEIKTTEAVTHPSPSAETIKISSKFKMPEKIAEIFKDEPKEDFGKFAYETLESSSEEDVNEIPNDDEKSNDDAEDDDLEISSLDANSTQFNVGRIVNVTIDSEDNTVNVNLDQNSLKEIFTGKITKLYSLSFLSHLILHDDEKSINFYYTQVEARNLDCSNVLCRSLFFLSSFKRLPFHLL